jgi:Ser/Thr protein kinase RdoA (MazF antagonist)
MRCFVRHRLCHENRKERAEKWGFEGAAIELVAARENAVYRIESAGQTYALRLHRQGYRSDAELMSELDWMSEVSRNGVSVPMPLPSLAGAKLVLVDGVQVDVLSWLTGTTLDHMLPEMSARRRQQTFHQLGIQMAELHRISDAWHGAAACDRPNWDRDGLVGPAPLWDRFWENPKLTVEQKKLLIAFRDNARRDLDKHDATQDFGLIHADLVSQNVMVDDDVLHLIDFDDGGFGYRLFEVATAFYPHRNSADFDTLKTSLAAGYHSIRPLNMSGLDLFLALRAMTYVGWNIARLDEDPSGERNARHITSATQLAAAYLKT